MKAKQYGFRRPIVSQSVSVLCYERDFYDNDYCVSFNCLFIVYPFRAEKSRVLRFFFCILNCIGGGMSCICEEIKIGQSPD